MESAKIDFLTFCLISSKFMTEEDEEGLKEELKEAFRIYDRDGQGFITTDVLKEILREIDSELTEDDLDNIIEEVDEDGSGTLDFDGKLDSILDLSNKFAMEKSYLCQHIYSLYIFYFRVSRDDDGIMKENTAFKRMSVSYTHLTLPTNSEV